MISYKTQQRDMQQDIYNFYKNSKYNNCVTRQMKSSAIDLYNFEKNTEREKTRYRMKDNTIRCYGCNKEINKIHKNYVFSCTDCGSIFQKYRHLSKDLTGYTSLVVGGRTKLGHQTVVKLLKAGAKVYATTREPEKAYELYSEYKDLDITKLVLLKLDLDTKDLETATKKIANEIGSVLDIIVFVAAQTIRAREKPHVGWLEYFFGSKSKEKNRYGDSKFVSNKDKNSWGMRIGDITQKEMEEIMRINAVAPTILIQTMIPLMKNSDKMPYIINIHAREGLFEPKKNGMHPHTNIGKAGMSMLTKCLVESNLKTIKGAQFSIHGCDPGWISVDEYYEDSRPWNVPPLDEVDGAARILFPIFNDIKFSESRTRRHFKQLTY